MAIRRISTESSDTYTHKSCGAASRRTPRISKAFGGIAAAQPARLAPKVYSNRNELARGAGLPWPGRDARQHPSRRRVRHAVNHIQIWRVRRVDRKPRDAGRDVGGHARQPWPVVASAPVGVPGDSMSRTHRLSRFCWGRAQFGREGGRYEQSRAPSVFREQMFNHTCETAVFVGEALPP